MEFRYEITDTTYRVSVGIDFADDVQHVTVPDRFSGKPREYKLDRMTVNYFGTGDDKDRFEPVVSVSVRRILATGKISDARTRLESWNTPGELYAEFVKLADKLDPR